MSKTQSQPEEVRKICQNCKGHSNNPSRCRPLGKFVGRKAEACDQFSVKK